MSKSKGNVIDPLEMIDKYGADAFRAALIFGVKEGADFHLSDEKIIGMRNFTNKIWNIGRFLWLLGQAPPLANGLIGRSSTANEQAAAKIIGELKTEFKTAERNYRKQMRGYRFSAALGEVYEFLWHRFADIYIERLKDSLRTGNIEARKAMERIYFENLRLLHPFMPFVTEAVWQVFHGDKETILNN
ncbi:class I tRNA ligase family protein [Candidatus Roizmanbacteria bacterium]|nr:class I tRNA ligase family protein [Candidatus Roizmanbacteria bacterium]